MPRSNLCANRDEQWYENVSNVLWTGLEVRHISDEQAGARLGVTARTIRNKRVNPKSITLKELRKLSELAGVRITFEQKNVLEKFSSD